MTAAHDEQEQASWERACVLRAQAGDAGAFAELYHAFAPRLYSHVLLPKLGQAQAAEDALSETFRALLEHIAKLDAQRSLWPWLCRVASNKATDMHRSHARARRALCSFESLLGPLLPVVESSSPRELDEARVGLQRAVRAVLLALSPRYRHALELRFLEDLPRAQCAERMAVKLGTFDVLLLRALRAFRQHWQAQLASAERDVG